MGGLSSASRGDRVAELRAEAHLGVTVRLLLETIVLLVLAALLAVRLGAAVAADGRWLVAYLPLLLFQALLFQRLYIIGHEASHRKLVQKR